jgi:uncharacterized protein DUF5681
LAVSVSEMEMTDNAAPRHSGQWKKGQSGNPAGMPKGTRHRATMLAEKLMEDDAENIVRAVVNAAKAGDPTAMRLCVERLVPLRKGRPVVFDLPPVKTAAHIAGAVGELARAMAAGELTVEEASAASSVIEMQRRAIETSDFEVRLSVTDSNSTKRRPTRSPMVPRTAAPIGRIAASWRSPGATMRFSSPR